VTRPLTVVLMYPPSPAHRAALQDAAPGAQLLVATTEAEARELVADADAILGNRFFLQSLPHARRLRWMQSNSMGMDLVLTGAPLLGGVAVTNARGVYDDEVADHALALLLALARGLHLARDAQARRRWERRPLQTLAGTRALILGWGGIGRGIAARLAAFGVEVHAARRRLEAGPVREGRFTLWGEDWRQALPLTQWLVLALPLTPATRRLVGPAELAALPAGSTVVNVGRGGTLDDEALLAAIRAGRLAGAGLDVMEDEPLPAEHPLWGEERVLLTPHVGRSEQGPPFRWEGLFVENLRRFAAGEPLLNVVDLDAGY
jgi:phosphoglycerate dehydrogenase-like enzyme